MAVIPCVDRCGGGRRWTRTSGLLHVKHFRLNAVLQAREAERKHPSYAVTDSVATGLVPERRSGRGLADSHAGLAWPKPTRSWPSTIAAP